MTALEMQVRALMRENARTIDGYRFTVPSPELYPFQWLWDSCFHAIILRHFDMQAAQDEIRSALAHPLADGLLPHIIYWKHDYRITNWGRERRGDIINNAWGVEGTSALTQPPIIAEAVRLMLDEHFDEAFAREVYPKLKAYYAALIFERDIDARGLLGIINPDESGEDNSPRFDNVLRIDVEHTNDEHLDKRLHLIEQHLHCDFSESCMKKFFWVEDVPFNAIAIVGFRALAVIAERLDEEAEAARHRFCAATIEKAMRTYLLDDMCFHAIERTDGRSCKITTETWALFAPLYAGIATDAEAAYVVERYLTNEEKFWTPFPIPTTALTEPSFHRDGFWRGPTWMAPNWFVYHGLKNYGFHMIAREVRHRSEALIAKSGFREQYDPLSGAGLGAQNFTWGGLVIDME